MVGASLDGGGADAYAVLDTVSGVQDANQDHLILLGVENPLRLQQAPIEALQL